MTRCSRAERGAIDPGGRHHAIEQAAARGALAQGAIARKARPARHAPNHQQIPRILVQDAPTVGYVFTRLAITFQALHEYGAAALDYVGAQAGIP